MTRFRNRVLMAAGISVLVLVVGVFSAGPAIAQAVRAALVSNVDDPGRIPYQLAGSCNFTSGVCDVHLPKVPDGKRLVLTHVSGEVDENLPAGTLINVRVLGRSIIHLPVTYIGNYLGLNSFVFDQQVLLFSSPTDNTLAQIYLGAPANIDSFAEFNFTGYMLDCTTGPCAAVAP